MSKMIFKSFLRNKCLRSEICRRGVHLKVTNIHPQLEQAFNAQINVEFYASFTYLALANHFARRSIALPGCHKFFLNQFYEENEHGFKIVQYLSKRGGNVILQAIEAPSGQIWDCPLAAFKRALELEKEVSKKIFELHAKATELNDISACNFLENDYVDVQIEEYDKLSRHVAQLERIGNDEGGILIFDKNLSEGLNELEKESKKNK